MDEPNFANDQSEPDVNLCRAAQRDDDDLRAVLSTPQGRRFVRRVLGLGRLFQPSFAADPLTTAFNEGCRNQALAVLAMVDAAAPDMVSGLLTTEPE